MQFRKNVQIIGGVPFTQFEPVPEDTPLSFDGGCRQAPPEPPRVQWYSDPEERGWQLTEVDIRQLWGE